MELLNTKTNQRLSPVPQVHPMGCAVACVASLCRIRYDKALQLFQTKEHAWTRGFYCSEVVQALAQFGLEYVFDEYDSSLHSAEARKTGTIVFVAPGAKYPAGHYLLRTAVGWMNPWSNFPIMSPVRATVEKRLPGRISYLVYSKTTGSSQMVHP